MPKSVLVLVDIQNDYFPFGAFPLEGPERAATNAARLLEAFRAKGLPVVHVRHESARPGATFFLPGTPGAEIHPSVAPLPGEPVVVKRFPNGFRETGLRDILDGLGAGRVVLAGMMTHMCVDATARAAADLGYDLAVAADACATRALEFRGRIVPAEDAHAAFLAALAFGYATVANVEELLEAGV